MNDLDSDLKKGEVALVGAGPGDPSLLTVAAMKLLGGCDTLVYDALVSPRILSLVSGKCEKIFAGKRGGRPSAKQEDICRTLVEKAREGKRVVRLKGGDPFLFGRGGEEIRALAQAGIPFRVVPGITAGIAAPAMAGIPITDRNVNATVAFLTGQEAMEDSRIDWKALVAAFPVLVIYMGVKNLNPIAVKLLEAGMDGETPLALLRSVTWQEESMTFATLGEAARGKIQGESPSVLIIGDVVKERSPWRERDRN